MYDQNFPRDRGVLAIINTTAEFISGPIHSMGWIFGNVWSYKQIDYEAGEGGKYFTWWEPHLLGKYFDKSVIHGIAGALHVLILHVTRNPFLPEKKYFQPKENVSRDNKLSPASTFFFLPQITKSCYFMSQEII